MALTDKKYANEHPKFNMFDKYKADKDSLVGARADISQKDIDLSKSRGYSEIDLNTAKILSGKPTLTRDELKQLKEAAKNKKDTEPTGKFKKD